MRKLVGVLFVGAPVVLLIFYFVLNQQAVFDSKFEKESAKFDREWSETKAELSHDKKNHLKRAQEAETRLAKAEKKERESERELEQIKKEFNEAMKEELKKQEKWR